MPFDKHNNNQQHAPRPLMPTLSAANKATRPPLTPRIAGSTPSSTPPTLRRNGTAESNLTPKAGAKDDISTPVKAFLSHNITPRSSSRKARGDSSSSTPTATPNGTPNGSKPASVVDFASSASTAANPSAGLGIDGIENAYTARPKSPVSNGRSGGYTVATDLRSPGNGHQAGGSADETSPLFFFASDVKSTTGASRCPLTRPPLQSKTSTFFYASEQNHPVPSGSAMSASPTRSDTSHGKFFHACSPPGTQPVSLPGSTTTPTPPPAPQRPYVAARPANFSPNHVAWQQPRPASPPKPVLAPTSAPSRGPPLQAPDRVNRLSPSPMGPGSVSADAIARGQSSRALGGHRQSFGSTYDVTSHGRPISMGSIDSGLSARNGSGTDSVGPNSPVASPNVSDGLNTALPDIGSTDDEARSKTTSPVAVSPSLSSAMGDLPASGKLQQMNELAANARRERKVLDLEISNSSLMAINRTLEREMRKQTAELRRFRRLSRTGRLSLATASMRSSSGRRSLGGGTDDGGELSDVLEDEDDYEDEDEFSPSDEESMDEGSLSPEAMAESDARHLAKDERRLQLDLSKHQQLLIDSQKMNQSLKRCLGWTEELISEGKKALDYHVRVSEVELGGRVLAPDEIEDEDGDAEFSHDGTPLAWKKSQPMRLSAGSERDDRDSGVEVEQSRDAG